MKKIIFVIVAIVMLFSTALVFAQDSVSDYTGHNWTGWSYQTKVDYISGFLVGLDVARLAIDASDTTESIKDEWWEYFSINDTVGGIINKVNYHYSQLKDYDSSVWSVIMVEYDKYWW